MKFEKKVCMIKRNLDDSLILFRHVSKERKKERRTNKYAFFELPAIFQGSDRR